MNILVACEESQRVCAEFRDLGHTAFSCDIQPCSGGHPEWHIMGDVLPLLDGHCTFVNMQHRQFYLPGRWDMIIAFPPCTYLTVAGNKYFNTERYGSRALERLEMRKKAVEFFLRIAAADCDRIAIENPIGVMSTHYRKPDQIIQPWMFGHNASKHTCLWLKGLPKLESTDIVPEDKRKFPENQVVGPDGKLLSYVTLQGTDGKKLSWNNPETAKLRSKTFPGIALAMAMQWGSDKEDEE